MKDFLTSFARSESGATAAEYALLIAFIAVVIIGGATVLGQNISSSMSSTGSTI